MPRRLSCCFAFATLAALAFTASAAGLDVAGLDKSVDPCSDLYQFANRRWMEAATIPDDRTNWSTFAIIDQRNEKVLEAAFQEALGKPLPPEGSAQRKVLQF